MEDFEKLGVFYLGRPYDMKTDKPRPGLLLYDSRDLVTHAVCIGMTGSGKTGLCLCLLEEAALDGVPAIAIDPKGDLPNLLLTFPGQTAEEFRPWVNEDDARTRGLTVADYARQQAEMWKNGLAQWGEDAGRIRRLRAAADFAIYTPGSSAGLPLSILKSFAAPPAAIRADPELLAERINTTTTGLLTLLGLDADPIRSREHILVSTILDAVWKGGQDPDLPALIGHIQSPPVSRVGVIDLESFYPANNRFDLAMRLNNLLAAPSFAAWLQGDPLDVDRLLFTAEGKPRVSVISIAHLNDAERMFFVTVLLNQVLGWMRVQSGSTSLRAILYMDEIFGYFPPVANPPSKGPLLTLLKQARAFGLGVVLATQNPVDLDYKGLANTGTWFLGRLQTERDKARVLEGLEGAAAGSRAAFNRQSIEQTLAGLKARVFLLHNVHEDAPEVFETRWAMSYLRGPLTREQIKMLMAGRRSAPVAVAAAPPPATAPAAAPPARSPTPSPAPADGRTPRPVVPPDVPQHFLPLRRRPAANAQVVYLPMLFGAGRVQFSDDRRGVDLGRDVTIVVPIVPGAIGLNWEATTPVELAPADLAGDPEPAAGFAELPPAAVKAKSYVGWTKDFSRWLYQTQRLDLLRSPTGLVSRPGESERDFRIRLQAATHERRDQASERLRQKYASKIATLTERLRRARQTVDRETEQARQQQVQTAVSVGATLLGAFIGRKAAGVGTLGRATTAARGASRSVKEAQDVGRARETVEAVQAQLADLEAQFRAEVETKGGGDPVAEALEAVGLKPKRTQISVTLAALAWAPHAQTPDGSLAPLWS